MIRIIILYILSAIPLPLKLILYKAWIRASPGFWLYAKSISHSPLDLVNPRFTWKDLGFTLKIIRKRFPKEQVYLLSDREDAQKTGFREIQYLRNHEELPNGENQPLIVICAYESDGNLLHALKALKDKKNVFFYSITRGLPVGRYLHRNDLAREVLLQEYQNKKGKFDLPDFEYIIQALELTRAIQGVYLEIGVYKGDSAVLALKYMQEAGIERNSYFVDLFEGFSNAPSESSPDGFWYSTHNEAHYGEVSGIISKFRNAHVIKMDIIQDELPAEVDRVSLCNIDVDQYEATYSALCRAGQRMNHHGIIICEDAGHTPFLGGALLAVEEFLRSDTGKKFMPIQLMSGQYYLIKLLP